MPMVARSNLVLYKDNTCQVFQGKNVTDIGKQLNEICDWFVDTKLKIYFQTIKPSTSFLFKS